MNDDKVQTDELINQTVLDLKRALEEENAVREDNKVAEPEILPELEMPSEAEMPVEDENVDYGEIKNKPDDAYTVPNGGLPISLSIETEGSLLIRIANIGDRLPIKAMRVFSTGTDIPEALAVRLYAGERLFAEDNICIAELKLCGIRKLSHGRPIVTVVIEIDYDMNITMEATDEGSLASEKISVDKQWIPTSDIILDMVKDAREKAAVDAAKALKIRRLQTARESLCRAELCYKETKKRLNPEENSRCRRYIRELKTKLKKIKSYDMTDAVEKSLTDAVNKLNAIFSDE